MQYFIAFLEGIITFISPCLLPLLPVYVSYFAGGEERTVTRTLKNAAGFVAGFTVLFVLMGALAGTVGGFLQKYQTAVNVVTGLVVIFFGLNFLGVLRINLFRGMKHSPESGKMGFFSSMLFGMVFSIGWTPCVGAFLGSALMLASQQGQAAAGVLMLLAYSLGLGIPFLASAVLIDRLKNAFQFIKRNYKIINIVSGTLLILVGVLMMTGLLGRLLAVLWREDRQGGNYEKEADVGGWGDLSYRFDSRGIRFIWEVERQLCAGQTDTAGGRGFPWGSGCGRQR